MEKYDITKMHRDRVAFWVLLGASGVLSFSVLTPPDALFGLCLAAFALIIAISDIDRFEIPDWMNALVFLLGLGWIFHSSNFDEGAIADALLRSLAATGILYAVRTAYSKVRGFDGLGLGDVKLAAAGAPWLSWPLLPIALLVAVSAALLLIAAQAIIGRGRIEPHVAVPLGAFLAPAIWFVWFTNSAVP